VSDVSKPPLTTTTSIWPAASIFILAVVVLGSFMIINLVSDQGVVTTTTTVPNIVGGLATASASTILQRCQQPENPPANIADALLVPQSTQSTGSTQLPNEGAGDFDCFRPLVTQASPAALLNYYTTQLEARGWNLFSKGASNGSPQSLFQKAGSDGFYWVVGITVQSSTTSSAHWTYTIYQNSGTV
jgi:hypothetical protein